MYNFSKSFMELIKRSSLDEIRTIQSVLAKLINDEIKYRNPGKGKLKKIPIIPPSRNRIPVKAINLKSRMKYIKFILDQDWNNLFDDPALDRDRKYYVYAHYNPNERLFDFSRYLNGLNGTPFYIGKGSGERAFDLNRNQGHGIKIKEVLDMGFRKRDIVAILRNGLTEKEALALESKLIYLFQTVYESPKHGVLYNLDTGKRPDFKRIIVQSRDSLVVVRKNKVEYGSN